MDRKLFASILVALALFGGVGFFALNNRQNSNQAINQSTQQPNNSNQVEQTISNGKYVAYDKAVFDADKSSRVLFFHASWCPQCRQLDSEIKANTVPSGTTIYKVDYDSNQDLRKKYGVTLQTTFVKIDEQGNLLKKYVSYEDPTFKSISQNIF